MTEHEGFVPDEPDGTDGPITQTRLRYEGNALLIPEWWDRERACWEVFRAQNRANAYVSALADALSGDPRRVNHASDVLREARAAASSQTRGDQDV